jgi:hypothetical protein
MSWRDAGKTARIVGMDARAVIGMTPFLFHMTPTMFWISLASTAMFGVGQFMGIGPVELFRRLRFWIGGVERPLPARMGIQRDRVNMFLQNRWRHRSE